MANQNLREYHNRQGANWKWNQARENAGDQIAIAQGAYFYHN